jgi:hypothetical protein
VFISYAGEDRDQVASPLARTLSALGVKVWYDVTELQIGDSLRESIDRGLARSRFGVVILSPSFFAKHYPQRELNGLAQKEIDGENVLLPVWHRVNDGEVRRYSPPLADRIAARWDTGLVAVVERLLRKIRPDIAEKLEQSGPLANEIARVAPSGTLRARGVLPYFRDVRKKQWQRIPLDQRPFPFAEGVHGDFDIIDCWGMRLQTGSRYIMEFKLQTSPEWEELECVFYLRAPMGSPDAGTWKRVISAGAAVALEEHSEELTTTGEDWLVTCWGKRVSAGSYPWLVLWPAEQRLMGEGGRTLVVSFAAERHDAHAQIASVSLTAALEP